MKKKVLITYNMFKKGYAELMEKYDVTLPPEGIESFTFDEVMAVIDLYDAILPMYNFPINKELMDAGKKLQIVSNYAVGFDNIDVPYATQKGIVVCNTPDPTTEPTAEIAMGLIYAVMRRMPDCDRRLRDKTLVWSLLGNLGRTLWGKTLGIIGMGRIGQSVARRALAAGMKIIYYNRHQLSPELEEKFEARYVTLDELFSTADVVSVNAPLTPETHHIVNAERLKLMKQSAYLINTARGPLVDEKALIETLQKGEIAGAGLDVYEPGEFVCDELLKLENTVLLPHLGTQTFDSRNEMAEFSARNIINFFEGGKITRVN